MCIVNSNLEKLGNDIWTTNKAFERIVVLQLHDHPAQVYLLETLQSVYKQVLKIRGKALRVRMKHTWQHILQLGIKPRVRGTRDWQSNRKR